MQIEVSDLRFYIFFVDKSMLSLRICNYSMDKLIIEVLNTLQNVKFTEIKGPGVSGPLGFETKHLPWGPGFDDF